jgi:indolepyruvate ferredoxin oxidoreductase
MKIDPRYLVESGTEIYTGTELLLKGCMETPGGVGLLTGYPGSPVAGFFDAIQDATELLGAHGVCGKMANNEALSVAMVNGAQMVGVKGMAVFKSVGLHVASDALALGNLAGIQQPGGGAVICSGDDPWSDSTQVPADSRFLFETLRCPVMEPASPQELKDWVGHAFDLSAASSLYIGYLVTVQLADGGGTVECRRNEWPVISTLAKIAIETSKIPVETSVLLPPRSWRQELTFDDRFARLLSRVRQLGLSRIEGGKAQRQRGGEAPKKAPIGFISSGPAYAMLIDALREMGLAGEFPILKLALSYPVDMVLVDRMAGLCERMVVIEERRSFIEKQIAEHLGRMRQNKPDSAEGKVELWGKEFPRGAKGIPTTRGLHPSLLIERLTSLLRDTPGIPHELANGRLSEELDTIEKAGRLQVTVPTRTPAFCPGCPHRDSSSSLLEIRKKLLDPVYMKSKYNMSTVDLVSHGDTGCYTMLMFEPNKPLMHNYSGMGLGGGTGAGVDPFITNKQIVFMGDGTFFHSGKLAISNAITQQQDITFIILENRTTAMTGHQPNPTLEEDIMGNKVFAHDIERIVKTLIPEAAGGLTKIPAEKNATRARVIRMNPASRDEYKTMLERVILEDGVKIVIADKECGITFHRRKRRAEQAEKKDLGYVRQKTYMNITDEVCEYCLECTNQTGCPGLKIVDTDYGKKMQTDFTTCVNDGACARIDACPSFEQVIVTRKRPPRLPDEVVDLTGIPEPAAHPKLKEDAWLWRCYMAGVGGMGIGVAGDILVRAAHTDGLYVGFIDKKGLAIRNGGVFSQLVFSKQPIEGSPVMPFGKADLLIGVDAVEAARACSPQDYLRVASNKFTHAVVNTGKTHTILSLMGRDDFEPEELATIIKGQCKPGQFFSFNVGDLCERLLDSKLYANIMMLGVAYQLGFLPLSYKALTWAIRHAVGREFERNYRAFNIGRKIVLRPDLFGVSAPKEIESVEQAIERKSNILKVSSIWGKGNADEYKKICKETLAQMSGLEDALKRDYVIRLFDAIQWGALQYGRSYATRVVKTYQQDHEAGGAKRGHPITRAVIWNLAKVMMIKDEVYVSMMYTSPEKYRRDRRRFNVNPANGDKLTYVHLNRPEFVVGGKHFVFHWKTKDWHARILRHCRWLRKLLPGWHVKEKDFRSWYMKLVDGCAVTEAWRYDLWLEILQSPEAVTGYREVRHPKQEVARQKVSELMHALEMGDVDGKLRPTRNVSLTNQVIGTFRG